MFHRNNKSEEFVIFLLESQVPSLVKFLFIYFSIAFIEWSVSLLFVEITLFVGSMSCLSHMCIRIVFAL